MKPTIKSLQAEIKMHRGRNRQLESARNGALKKMDEEIEMRRTAESEADKAEEQRDFYKEIIDHLISV